MRRSGALRSGHLRAARSGPNLTGSGLVDADGPVGPVGSLGSRCVAGVDGRGRITLDGGESVDWWIGADDRWHVPGREPAVRRHRLGAAPVYETAMRVPGGDAIQRVYGVSGDRIVIEVENGSPAPVALAFVTVATRRGPALTGREPLRVVRARDDDALLAALEAGETGAPSGRLVAELHPIAHRTRIRVAFTLDSARAAGFDPASAPSPADAARGWAAVLRRGTQVTLADPARQLAVDRARVDVLLETGARPTAAGFVALEEWGFDVEAAAAWAALGLRERRRAAARAPGRGSSASRLLRTLRDRLLHEDGHVISLLPAPPELGEDLEVHDAPTRAGGVSFAVRWHGTRAALLWERHGEDGVVSIRAPGFDPAWSATEPAGETLFGERDS